MSFDSLEIEFEIDLWRFNKARRELKNSMERFSEDMIQALVAVNQQVSQLGKSEPANMASADALASYDARSPARELSKAGWCDLRHGFEPSRGSPSLGQDSSQMRSLQNHARLKW